MKIQIMSDLHLEYHKDFGLSFAESVPVAANILVLAGDIAAPLYNEIEIYIPALEAFARRWRNVFMVMGNHEYYHASTKRHPHLVRFFQQRGITVLDNGVGGFAGVNFRGTTLWFKEDPLVAPHKHAMRDFDVIQDFEPWVYRWNRKGVGYLRQTVRRDDIVITHHLPSEKCVAPRYEKSPLNAFFVTPMDDLMYDEHRSPALWIFGHTHASVDRVIGHTRVVCNPFGYFPDELNPDFKEDYVVEYK